MPNYKFYIIYKALNGMKEMLELKQCIPFNKIERTFNEQLRSCFYLY